jgi:hypothetical protein
MFNVQSKLREQIDTYWAGLNDEKRRLIEAAAFDVAKPLLREGHERATAHGRVDVAKIIGSRFLIITLQASWLASTSDPDRLR